MVWLGHHEVALANGVGARPSVERAGVVRDHSVFRLPGVVVTTYMLPWL